MTNTQVIALVQQGDERAWERFIQEHQQAVYRLAYLMLGDAAEAEDIAQETFLRAFRAIHSFDTDRAARPWLLHIAANLVRNRRRSMGRYIHALNRLFNWAEPPPPTLAETSTLDWEARTLWEAVKRLRASDQQIIYLRYFLELSEIETAESLGIAHGTVKSRSSRALTRLRTVIDHEFPSLREEREA